MIYHLKICGLDSERENIKFETLKKNLEETHNIYEAVRLTIESKQKRNGDILYKGNMMTASAISEMEELDAKSLRRHLEESKGNIEEAVRLELGTTFYELVEI